MSNTDKAAGERAAERDELLLALFLFTLFELIVAIWCMFQQITTTHDSVFGLLQGGTLTTTHLTGDDVIKFLQGNQDKYNKIAYTVAFVTQTVFLGTLMPGSPVHNRTLRRIIAAIFFVLEVTSDLWYAAATGTTLGGAFTWVFSLGGGGWLADLAYIIAMSAGSTLLLLHALHNVGKLFAGLRKK
jgi:hypothetical protein